MTDNRELLRIKDLANEKRVELMGELGIKEKPSAAGLLLISDPKAKDETPSFAIWTKNGTLTFKRYGTSIAGDVIDFVAYMNGWYDLPKKGRGEALRWLKSYLRIESVPAAQLDRDASRSRNRSLEQRKSAGEKLAADRRSAFDWFKGADALRGSFAWRYLTEARGLDLDALPKGPRGGSRIPSVLRSLSRCKHIWDERGSPRHGQESFWPALMAGCTDTMTSGVLAVHRTWLKRDGSDKAPVVPPRKTWPAASGLVIPLWRGDSNLSVSEACAAGLRETFVLAEGIESALSAVMAAPQYRTWAFIFLDNLALLELPECCDTVMVCRENDWAKRGAVAAFERGKRHIERSGRPVVEWAAIGGKDLNDTLRGVA